MLLGIKEEDWQKIKQVAIKIYDLEERVEKVQALLETRELSEITVGQEPLFKNSSLLHL